MKTNLLSLSLVSVALFACGGRIDGSDDLVGDSEIGGNTFTTHANETSNGGTSFVSTTTQTKEGGSSPATSSGVGGQFVTSIPPSVGGALGASVGGNSSIGGSSEATTGGATEPPCIPEVQVRYLSHGTANVEPGAQDVATLKFQLTATCVNQEVEALDAHISALGYDASSLIPFRSANGENFQDIKVVDLASGNVVAGPILSKDYTSNEKAHLTFKDSFALLQDTPRILEIRVDVSSTFLTDSMKNQYTVYFNGINIKNGGDVPIVMSYADGFDGANWPSFTVTSGS